MNKFYVYAWLRADGTPFYIGKGCGRRAWTQNCHLQKVPQSDRVRLLAEGLSNDEALEWEKDLISLLGRKIDGSGCLRNLTTGGEGISGHRHSTESRMKMSVASKGKSKGPQSLSHKEKRAEARRKRVTWAHPEHGNHHCSASELVQAFGSLSRAGLSRLMTGKACAYKGWSICDG